MPNTVRVDQQAFNHGVDEILTMKPIRRSIKVLLRGVRTSGNGRATPRTASTDLVLTLPAKASHRKRHRKNDTTSS